MKTTQEQQSEIFSDSFKEAIANGLINIDANKQLSKGNTMETTHEQQSELSELIADGLKETIANGLINIDANKQLSKGNTMETTHEQQSELSELIADGLKEAIANGLINIDARNSNGEIVYSFDGYMEIAKMFLEAGLI